jgi:uncharacterized CHY-type Zn-finger protein
MTHFKHEAPKSVNCQACGNEFLETELRTVKISGFSGPLMVCGSCLEKTAEDSFKDAADMINEIVFIARYGTGNPERRLQAIKVLLGGE